MESISQQGAACSPGSARARWCLLPRVRDGEGVGQVHREPDVPVQDALLGPLLRLPGVLLPW